MRGDREASRKKVSISLRDLWEGKHLREIGARSPMPVIMGGRRWWRSMGGGSEESGQMEGIRERSERFERAWDVLEE